MGLQARYPCAAAAGSKRATIRIMKKGSRELTSNPISGEAPKAANSKPHKTLNILDQMAVKYTLPPQVKLMVGVVKA